MIAPDDKTYAYLKGPPEGAEGQGLGRGRALLGNALSPTTARISTARSGSTPPSCRRSSPGAPAPSRWSRSAAACRCRPRLPTKTSAAPPSARSTTWASRAARRSPTSSSTASSSAPAPMARIEDLRDVARIVDGKTVNANLYGNDRARFRPREGAGGSRRPRQDLQGRRLRLARAGLLDVPGHESRQAARRASAAPRPRTATSRAARATRAARTWCRPRWRPRRRSPDISSTCGSGSKLARRQVSHPADQQQRQARRRCQCPYRQARTRAQPQAGSA